LKTTKATTFTNFFDNGAMLVAIFVIFVVR